MKRKAWDAIKRFCEKHPRWAAVIIVVALVLLLTGVITKILWLILQAILGVAVLVLVVKWIVEATLNKGPFGRKS